MKIDAKIWIIIALAGALLLTLSTHRKGTTARTVTQIDTVIVRDTIREIVPVPKYVYATRIDTVFLTVPGDTVRVEVQVPIERKVYQTEDYRAEIEGFRPSLVNMEIYRRTQTVTNTVTNTVTKRPRFGVGIQAGYGIVGNELHPYIGVGVQYNLFTF
jgi:hypothetical protein